MNLDAFTRTITAGGHVLTIRLCALRSEDDTLRFETYWWQRPERYPPALQREFDLAKAKAVQEITAQWQEHVAAGSRRV